MSRAKISVPNYQKETVIRHASFGIFVTAIWHVGCQPTLFTGKNQKESAQNKAIASPTPAQNKGKGTLSPKEDDANGKNSDGNGNTNENGGGTNPCASQIANVTMLNGQVVQVNPSYGSQAQATLLASQGSSKDSFCNLFVKQGNSTVSDYQGLYLAVGGRQINWTSSNRACLQTIHGLTIALPTGTIGIVKPAPATNMAGPVSLSSGTCVARKFVNGVPSSDATWFVLLQ